MRIDAMLLTLPMTHCLDLTAVFALRCLMHEFARWSRGYFTPLPHCQNFPTPQIIETEKAMKYLLNYDQTRCSGCLQCQLTCSFQYFSFFQLSASYIQINSHENEYKAIFTDDCTRCGYCADYCLFGALTKSREEVQP